jgi:hypothetical protein
VALLTVAAVVVVAVVGLGIWLGTRDGDVETAGSEAADVGSAGSEPADTGRTPGTTAADLDRPLTEIELVAFRNACVSEGVPEPRCDCAIERATAELEPRVLRRGLREILERDGALTDELVVRFQACQDDGL